MSKRFRIVSITVLFLAAGLMAFAGPHRGRGMGEGRGPGMGKGMPPRIAAELDLTEDQRQEMRAIFERYREGSMGEQRQSMKQARKQLRELIHDPQADEQQVLDAARIVSGFAEDLALERHRMSVEISQVLTEEQRRKAKELHEQREQKAERRGRHSRGPARGSWDPDF